MPVKTIPENNSAASFVESQSSRTKSQSKSAQEETFQWTQQWYPVAAIEILDPFRPHPVQLLGKSLVIWRDAQQQWHCFEDACPHRLVPLSEGRVEADGTLLCAYHAWRFDGEGNCTSIPQSKNAAAEANHCARDKACAIAYPTQEIQGLLWVWPESGKAGANRSKTRSPRLIAELEDTSKQVKAHAWNQRDLPYGWEYFMENVSDPAHVPVSHHGIMGNRYTDAKYYDMSSMREVSTQDGFAFSVLTTSKTLFSASHDFQPPCLMKISFTLNDGSQLILVLYATPTKPGWCRHIGRQVFIQNKAGKNPPGLGFLALPMPQWLSHIVGSLFLHQDLVFLHHQEHNISKRKLSNPGHRWIDEVYVPNPQDKMVVALHQWLEQRADGGVTWDETCNPALPLLEKEQLFDVWAGHTQHCQHCQRALRRIDIAIELSFVAAVGLLIAAIVLDARVIATQGSMAQPSLSFWAMVAGAILLAIEARLLQKLRTLFFKYWFEHADND